MKTEKKKRGRPPKHKAMEFEGMTYEGAINHALDKEVRADLDKCLADKDESQLTDDERKYLKRKKEKKSTPSMFVSPNRKCRTFFPSVSSTVTRTRPSISVIVFGRGLISRPTVPKLPSVTV